MNSCSDCDVYFYSAPYEYLSESVGLFCGSLCLSAIMFPVPHIQTSPTSLCMLLMSMARPPS